MRVNWNIFTNPFTFINMKLSDKFENAIFRHEVGRNEHEETKQQCAEIAEKFAIDFVKWWSENNEKEGTIIEILEIYKNTL